MKQILVFCEVYEAGHIFIKTHGMDITTTMIVTPHNCIEVKESTPTKDVERVVFVGFNPHASSEFQEVYKYFLSNLKHEHIRT